MGGDYEKTVEAEKPRRSAKGDVEPVDEVTVGSIRFHQSRGQVHFHDDKAGLKCYVPKSVWWGAWQKLRLPSEGLETTSWSHDDLDNESKLTITSFHEGDSVKVAIRLETYKPPSTYDRVWHALEQFTNLSSGS